MNIYINSPEYYTEQYGIIDEIYQLCTYISKNIDLTSYTDSLDTVGIVPIIAPIKEMNAGKCKEVRLISKQGKFASMSLHIDYERYVEADIELKKQLIVENILQSFRVIKKRLRSEFDYEMFEKDIKTLLS